MSTVKVTFTYEPEEPDDEHPVGMSDSEHSRLMDQLMMLGATDIEVEREAA